MAGPPPTPTALRGFHDELLEAYGPQHWWPTRDANNPRFEVLVGAVLTQHTAWTNVEHAITALREAGPLDAHRLLDHADLAALIRRAGPHRVKAQRLRSLCSWFIDAGGFAGLDRLDTRTLRTSLLDVRGVGFETADAILLYAFGRPQFVADAYAFRIFERYGWWQGRRRYETLRHAIEAAGPEEPLFFDELHALIVAHAKSRCHKHAPDCANCVLVRRCTLGQGMMYCY